MHGFRRHFGLDAAAVTAAILLGAFTSAAWTEETRTYDFKLPDLEGKEVSLQELLAHGPVLVDFWATWCKPCAKELPHLDAIAKEFAGRGVSVVAVSVDNPRSVSKVRSYVKSQNFSFIVVLDTNGEAKRAFKAFSQPYTVMLNPDGTKAFSNIGYKPGDEKIIREKIAALLASLPPSAGQAE